MLWWREFCRHFREMEGLAAALRNEEKRLFWVLAVCAHLMMVWHFSGVSVLAVYMELWRIF